MFMSIIFSILYYLGIISCGIQGAEKVNPENMKVCFSSMVRLLFSATLNGFGGGLIRDIFLWKIPVFFSVASILDLCLAISFALIYFFVARHLRCYRMHFERFAILCDSIGVSTFIIIGVGHALGLSLPIMMLCGMSTALFGGMAACIYNRIPLHFDAYKMTVMSGTLLYTLLIINDINMYTAQLLLCVSVFIGTLLSYFDIQAIIVKALQYMRMALFSKYEEHFIIISLSRTIRFRKIDYSLHDVSISYIRQRMANFPFLYIRLCRIRQM